MYAPDDRPTKKPAWASRNAHRVCLIGGDGRALGDQGLIKDGQHDVLGAPEGGGFAFGHPVGAVQVLSKFGRSISLTGDHC